MLGACLAALALATAGAIGAPDEIGIGSMRLADDPPLDPAGAGDPGRGAVERAELALVLGGPVARRDPRVARVSAEVVAARVNGDPAVAGVRPIEVNGGPVALVVDLGPTDLAGRLDALARLRETADPGPLELTFEGELPRLEAGRNEAADELWRLEVLVLPLVLFAVWTVAGTRGVIAAGFCSGLAIVGSLALLRVVSLIAEVSLLGFAAAAPVGLVLGVELGLLTLRRLDEASSGGGQDVERAIVDGVGLTVLAAAAATLPALGLLLTPLDQAGSLVLGCALAAVLAGFAAVCFVPALAAGIAALRSRGLAVGGRVVLGPGPERRERRSPAAWLAALVAGRWVTAAAALALVSAGLAAAGLPLRDAATAPFAVLDPVSADSLLDELPAAGAVAAGTAGLLAAATLRAPAAVLLGPLAILPAAAALGAAEAVFVDREPAWLADLIEARPRPALDTGAVAAGAVALVAVAATRTTLAGAALRSDLRLGIRPAPAAYLAARATLPVSLAATLAGVLAAGAMVAADLGPAQELGLILAVGLAADLLLVRVPVLAAAAWLARIRWPRWRAGQRRARTASAG